MRPDVLAEHLAATIRGLLSPLALRLGALETAGGSWVNDLGDVQARLGALEARAPVPGPPGPAGSPGRDGIDGQHGAPGLRYLGVHVAGKTYDVGDVVTHGGSAWHCERQTTGAPGTSPDWHLMVKRGRAARSDTR